MQKDFNLWNEVKKKVDFDGFNKLYCERQIWWCSLGLNVGFEQNGTGFDFDRPVLILKGLSKQTCLIVPLTTSSRIHHTRVPLGMIDNRQASALLSQIKVVDTKRFKEKVGFLEQDKFKLLREIAKDFYFGDSTFSPHQSGATPKRLVD